MSSQVLKPPIDDHLSRRTIASTLKQPTRESNGSNETDFSLFDLAPNGVYQANQVTLIAGELLPHRFTLTPIWGGLFSVALSLTSRPVDVIDHSVLWSPDFPPDPHGSGDRLIDLKATSFLP